VASQALEPAGPCLDMYDRHFAVEKSAVVPTVINTRFANSTQSRGCRRKDRLSHLVPTQVTKLGGSLARVKSDF